MEMQEVTEDQFNFIIDKIGAEQVGQDVGRMHGIFSYERDGRFVGSSSFYRETTGRVWNYQIATYLWEAYGK